MPTEPMTKERREQVAHNVREGVYSGISIYGDDDVQELLDAITAAELRAEAAEKALADRWRTIETAPKGGRLVLTWAIVDTETGNWNQKISVWRAEPRNNLQCNWDGWPAWCEPTHWQPLPAPPAMKGPAE